MSKSVENPTMVPLSELLKVSEESFASKARAKSAECKNNELEKMVSELREKIRDLEYEIDKNATNSTRKILCNNLDRKNFTPRLNCVNREKLVNKQFFANSETFENEKSKSNSNFANSDVPQPFRGYVSKCFTNWKTDFDNSNFYQQRDLFVTRNYEIGADNPRWGRVRHAYETIVSKDGFDLRKTNRDMVFSKWQVSIARSFSYWNDNNTGEARISTICLLQACHLQLSQVVNYTAESLTTSLKWATNQFDEVVNVARRNNFFGHSKRPFIQRRSTSNSELKVLEKRPKNDDEKNDDVEVIAESDDDSKHGGSDKIDEPKLLKNDVDGAGDELDYSE